LKGEQILGVIYGDRLSTSTRYTSEDIDFFAAIARQMSIGLINCELLEEQRRMVQLNHDIEVARSIQTGLFPPSLPNRADLRIAALNDPGRRISGDYYDVVEREDGRIWCLVADVTGEGVAAALLMANFQAAVRVTLAATDDPGELLSRWNRFICGNSSASRFITCALALLDPKARTMRIGSAGHFVPVLIRADGAAPRELEVDSGFPLGVTADATFASTTHELGGDSGLLFFYTDGVTEAFDDQGRPFGNERLIHGLSERGDLNPQALIKRMRKQVATFVGPAEQSDDLTMLAVWLG
jgi:sigma-B regulation protein RsbU (phosphoserine phosphatase)